MSGISGVTSTTSYMDYGKVASGKAIQSAADGAAELAIATKQETVASGLSVGKDNMAAGKDLLNISDGALGSITDNLQRMRELALQSMNTATTTASDREKLQTEVAQLKQGIADIADQTQYNTKNLLDGSTGELMIATDDQGHGQGITTGNATLQALGIENFDLGENLDLDAIDKALEKVTTMRSGAGAQTNRIEYGMNYNGYTEYNMTASVSRLKDLDMGKGVHELTKKRTLETYALMMQKKRQEDEAAAKSRLFGA